jgi:hypothetical protein
MPSDEDDLFTMQEVRITLTAFAAWMLRDTPTTVSHAALVDQFIEETT